MPDIYEDGVVRRPIFELRIGDRIDLENDPIADPYTPDEGEGSMHPEFKFEFQVVSAIEAEGACIRVDFEGGFSCGFPPDHLIEVDGEQRRK